MSRDPLKAAIQAIVKGGHSDPFGVLGPHPSKKKGKMSVRAFLPWAATVFVLIEGDEPVEMDKAHDDGFFIAEVAGKPLETAYRFRVAPHHGETIEVEDPYRFPARIGEMDLYLLAEGTHLNSHEKLGAHPVEHCGVHGTYFALWAPNAKRVSVVGNFNGWDGRQHPMRNHPSAGIWEIFLPHVGEGDQYKFEIVGPDGNLVPLKTDPYAFYCEVPPKTASVVRGIKPYEWQDSDWMALRR